MIRHRLFLAPLLSLFAAAALPTSQEALNLAFPGATFVRKEHFLTEPQAQRVREASGTDLSGLWWVSYEAHQNGRRVGVAFFDAHRVRTLNGTAMVAVESTGTIRRVEVVRFQEPQDYLPKEAWLRQFPGRTLGPGLSLQRDIRPLAGATLTAHALVQASRRSLALYAVLYGG